MDFLLRKASFLTLVGPSATVNRSGTVHSAVAAHEYSYDWNYWNTLAVPLVSAARVKAHGRPSVLSVSVWLSVCLSVCLSVFFLFHQAPCPTCTPFNIYVPCSILAGGNVWVRIGLAFFHFSSLPSISFLFFPFLFFFFFFLSFFFSFFFLSFFQSRWIDTKEAYDLQSRKSSSRSSLRVKVDFIVEEMLFE